MPRVSLETQVPYLNFYLASYFHLIFQRFDTVHRGQKWQHGQPPSSNAVCAPNNDFQFLSSKQYIYFFHQQLYLFLIAFLQLWISNLHFLIVLCAITRHLAKLDIIKCDLHHYLILIYKHMYLTRMMHRVFTLNCRLSFLLSWQYCARSYIFYDISITSSLVRQ